ncbi:MAG: alkane 1-monooxygenase [Saprospiraceae bacterium]
MKDLKYLSAYLLPLSAVLALTLPGGWRWATVILAFGILPVLELWTPASAENATPDEEARRSGRWFFDLLLYLNLPVVYATLAAYLMVATGVDLSLMERLGLTLSVGIVMGANGINVAHELGHRERRFDQFWAKVLLLPTLYQHFYIEHNRGHHKYVATPQDPATARRNESLYAFWVRSVSQSWLGAWRLEHQRLTAAQLPVWSLHNEMLRFTLAQLVYLGTVAWVFGTAGLLAAIAVGVVSFLLLETINYIEHYGLLRAQLPSGRYEPVNPAHSWNSDHELGRIFLYELTRHSDHHFKATRKYQVLRHLDESPQLPFGYPTCMLIAVAPPLWFRLMNPILDRK